MKKFDKDEGFPCPWFTSVPDILIDEFMPEMSGAELKVVLCVIRYTFGFKKRATKFTFDFIQEKTGLSRDSVNRGIQKALERGMIKRLEDKQPHIYYLNVKGWTPDNLDTPIDENKDQYSQLVEVKKQESENQTQVETSPKIRLNESENQTQRVRKSDSKNSNSAISNPTNSHSLQTDPTDRSLQTTTEPPQIKVDNKDSVVVSLLEPGEIRKQYIKSLKSLWDIFVRDFSLSDTDSSEKFFQDLLEHYTYENISHQLGELRKQIKRGYPIENPRGLLISFLKNSWSATEETEEKRIEGKAKGEIQRTKEIVSERLKWQGEVGDKREMGNKLRELKNKLNGGR